RAGRRRSSHDAGLQGARRKARSYSGGDTCRWLGPITNRSPRNQPALLSADLGLIFSYLCPVSAPHFLQRKRTNSLWAETSARLLSAHEDGRAGFGKLLRSTNAIIS